MKEIVIIGGGYGGIRTAQRLEAKLHGRRDVRITLINATSYHTLRTRLHEAAGARIPTRKVCVELEEIFALKEIRLIQDTIVDVDFSAKRLTGADGNVYPYDYLVLATGTVPAYFGTPGAEEFSFPLSTYPDAAHLRGQIAGMVKAAAQTGDPELRKALLCFFITGGGFTGAEFAGELAEWLPILCRRHQVDPREASIVLCDMAPQLVPALPADQAAKCQRRLEALGVQVKLGARVKAVTAQSITLEEQGAEHTYPTHTVVWTAGVSGVPLMESVGKTLAMNGRNRIETDLYLRARGAEHVYAVGDNLFLVQDGRPVPQIAENAEESGNVAAANILAELNGSTLTPYRMVSHGTLVCIGTRFCTGRMSPNGAANIKLAGPMAILGKHAIHANYERGLLGNDAVMRYALGQLPKREKSPDF